MYSGNKAWGRYEYSKIYTVLTVFLQWKKIVHLEGKLQY